MSTRTSATFEFRNAGPLTTAWTLPSACSSVGNMVSGVARPGIPGAVAYGLGACTYDDYDPECWPLGEPWPEESSTFEYEPFQTVRTIDYHSPGLVCPSAWETAGVVSKENGTADASGVFASTVFHYYADDATPLPWYNFVNNALTAVLEPTETAIACCPSGFSADALRGCYSSIDVSKLAGTTGCAYQYGGNFDYRKTTDTFDYYGATITEERMVEISPTSESFRGDLSLLTYTVDASGYPNVTVLLDVLPTTTPELEGIVKAPMLYLINSGEKAGGDDESQDTDESKDGDDKNGASSMSGGSWTLLGGISAIWAVGFIGVCSL